MRRMSSALLVAALCACSEEPEPTQPTLEAQLQAKPNKEIHYEITKLPTLGGSVSLGTSINNRGWVAGFSNETGNATRVATLWRNGEIIPLGTLDGPNSSVQWPGLSNNGYIVGISQTSVADSLGEDWSCSSFIPNTGRVCLGFFYDDGGMHALPTLGGTHGFATGVNSRGQVVGWAETTFRDPTCNEEEGNQVLQFRAVMWTPRKGGKKELPPLPGHSTSAATAINERGQVVGIAGECDLAVGRFSARESVLWEDGKPIRIPNLGGQSWHTPMAINNAGDVVGFSNPAGDPNGEFIPHAFFWSRKRGLIDLKLFDGHDFSQAFGINARRQVVGRSCLGSACLAVLWEDGRMIDLNKRVDLEEGDVLTSARHINDRGEITGSLFEGSTRRTIAFVATPIR
ncbi:MAG TPA: hypothetical protein VJ596_00210 [Gemmatimonadaceae bacterium]|nr:hypothetical protein [Gemmatimonadaceae bacterium]